MENSFQPEVNQMPPMPEQQNEPQKKSGATKWLIGALVVAALAGCCYYFLFAGSKSDTLFDIQYVPFQAEKDGDWGLISSDGKVLFADEFEKRPTAVTNNRFFVENSEGMWEMYKADKKPKPVSDEEYVQVTNFTKGCSVTPVVRKDGPIEFIDKNGNVKVTFDKVDGKDVVRCYPFNLDGYAVFSVRDAEGEERCGIVDSKGNVTVKPQYSRMFFAFSKYFYVEKPNNDKKWQIIDQNGKEICSYSNEKYECVSIKGEKIVVRKDSGYGIIDTKGNVLQKPSSKYDAMELLDGDKFFFESDDKYGVKEIDGDVIIRPKYKLLLALGSNYVARKDDKYQFLDKKGEVIDLEDIDEIDDWCPTPDGIFVECDKEWFFVNKSGKVKPIEDDVYRIALELQADCVYNQALKSNRKLLTEQLGECQKKIESLTSIEEVRSALPGMMDRLAPIEKRANNEQYNSIESDALRTADRAFKNAVVNKLRDCGYNEQSYPHYLFEGSLDYTDLDEIVPYLFPDLGSGAVGVDSAVAAATDAAKAAVEEAAQAAAAADSLAY